MYETNLKAPLILRPEPETPSARMDEVHEFAAARSGPHRECGSTVVVVAATVHPVPDTDGYT